MMSARRTAIIRILAATALALSRSSKAFMMIESPMTTTTCHVNDKNNLLRRFNLLVSLTVESSSTTSSYRPQFKRRRKATNSLTINHAAVNKEEEEEEDDEHHRSISITQLNNSIIFRRSRADRNEILFQKRLAELQDFRLNHGHGSIPTPYPSNPSLGIWAANVRQQYSLWKHAEERGYPYVGYLTQSRRHQLQLAGFDFASLTERQFRTRLKELELFKDKYGHCMVPEKWEENVALGAWVSNLRSLYKKRMMAQQQQQVQPQQHDGEEGKGGIRDKPPAKIENQKQRRNRRILLKSPSHNLRKKRQRLPRFSHLDENRIQVLEEMGFVWSSIDRKWLEMLEWAKVYGVVNHYMKLFGAGEGAEEVGGDEDPAITNKTIPADWKYSTQQRSNHNRTILLDNYLQFVQNIQNQSILPSFHPQHRVLELLSEQAPSSQPESSLPQTAASDGVSISSSLDYRIRRNDPFHQPLRIWMINQRSNYNRLDFSINRTHELPVSPPLSTLSARRQRALEAIYFPWSGRFRSRVEELRYEQELKESMERQRERECKMEQKKRDEQERVEQLTSSIVSSVSSVGNGVVELVEDTDIMILWGEEDDEDDDDDDHW